ncbi:MAG: hypothetical protein ACYC4H_00805 [Desulfocucumaceae bacterium]
MEAIRTVQAEAVEVKTIVDTAQSFALNGRPCMISNTGAQPCYINPGATATAANGFLVAAGTTLPIKFTVSTDVNSGNLSVISNLTGTSVAVMYFDM